ncbi:MAG: ABC transporter substrate-binding protein [Phycisphaerales bacterium]
MRAAPWIIFVLFALILATPMVVRSRLQGGGGAHPGGAGGAGGSAAQTLMIVTPHVEQIRSEFGAAFGRWHQRVYGASVAIDWRTPGGTTEIVRLLQAQYGAAASRIVSQIRKADPEALLRTDFSLDPLFTPDTVPIDIMFGGGSFDHNRLKDTNNVSLWVALSAVPRSEPATLSLPAKAPELATLDTADPVMVDATIAGETLRVRVPAAGIETGGIDWRAALRVGQPASVRLDLARTERLLGVSMSAPAGFSKAQLDDWFGTNKIGSEKLYDPQQFWLGTALSGFGIVYNRDLLREHGLPIPDAFEKLCDPRYRGLLALADARQSGSVATNYDSVLNKEGWEKGWRILREMSANARYFASASTQPPIDVSQGEAIAGVAIDFYGRGQAQSIQRTGQSAEESRVGYIDPPGSVYIDADPVSILRGGRNPEIARHFVEFCLSEEGQALWQFAARSDPASSGNPRRPGAGGAESAAGEDRMGPLTSRLRRMPVRRVMYERYLDHFADKTNPFDLASDTPVRGWRTGLIVMMGAFGVDAGEELRGAWDALNKARTDSAFPPDRLAEMTRLFYSFPEHEMVAKDGTTTRVPFTAETYKAISDDTNRWRDPVKGTRARIAYTEYFRSTFRKVRELGRRDAVAAGR